MISSPERQSLSHTEHSSSGRSICRSSTKHREEILSVVTPSRITSRRPDVLYADTDAAASQHDVPPPSHFNVQGV